MVFHFKHKPSRFSAEDLHDETVIVQGSHAEPVCCRPAL